MGTTAVVDIKGPASELTNRGMDSSHSVDHNNSRDPEDANASDNIAKSRVDSNSRDYGSHISRDATATAEMIAAI